MDRGAWQATGGHDRVGHDGKTPRQQMEERPATQRGRRAVENWIEHDFFLAGKKVEERTTGWVSPGLLGPDSGSGTQPPLPPADKQKSFPACVCALGQGVCGLSYSNVFPTQPSKTEYWSLSLNNVLLIALIAGRKHGRSR